MILKKVKTYKYRPISDDQIEAIPHRTTYYLFGIPIYTSIVRIDELKK